MCRTWEMEIEMMKLGMAWPEKYEHEPYGELGVELLWINEMDVEMWVGIVLALEYVVPRKATVPCLV